MKNRNVAASIRAKLLHIAKSNNRNFNAVLLRYFQERILYRLSISKYRKNFVLKGALLFLIYDMPDNRPTKDIDFLGLEIANTENNILQIMRDIIEIECEDGVHFLSASLESELIQEHSAYHGIRVHCIGTLEQVKLRIHLDIGFGDIIVPNPITLNFPSIIENMLCPNLYVYSPESVISEKFEAIIKLGNANSRMKDFYDIYYLAQHYEFEAPILKKAMIATFKNRQTQLTDRYYIYHDDFMLNDAKAKQWAAFKKRILIEDAISFPDCVEFIKRFLEPLFDDTKSIIKWDTIAKNWY